MRPLPRLLAFADDHIAALDDLGIRAAAIAAVGPAVGLVARLPAGTTDQLASLAQRFVALATPPMASVFVTGRSDVARAVRANGVILRNGDLWCRPDPERSLWCRPDPERSEGPAYPRATGISPSATTGVLRGTQDEVVIRSVHSLAEAGSARAGGADALIVGSIWPSPTHPGRAPSGTALLAQIVSLGLPTYAIGGVTAARAIEAKAAGAWGVAAITAVWDTRESYEAAKEIVEVWR